MRNIKNILIIYMSESNNSTFVLEPFDVSGNFVNKIIVYNEADATRTYYSLVQGAKGNPGYIDIGIIQEIVASIIQNNPNLRGLDGVSVNQQDVINYLLDYMNNNPTKFRGPQGLPSAPISPDYNIIKSQVNAYIASNSGLFIPPINYDSLISKVDYTKLILDYSKVILNYNSIILDYSRIPLVYSNFNSLITNYISSNAALFKGNSGVSVSNITFNNGIMTILMSNGTTYISPNLIGTVSDAQLQTQISTYLTTNPLPAITTLNNQVSSLSNTVSSQGTSITALNSQVSALQTASSNSRGSLPFYINDFYARLGGLPQYGLYRNGTRSYQMRLTADIAYQYNFNGLQSYSVGVALNSSSGWTVEWWAYIPRLFQQSMVSIVGFDWTITFGLSGGGAFNVQVSNNSRLNFALGQPEVNNWYLFGAQLENGFLTMWMTKRGFSGGNTLFKNQFVFSGYAQPRNVLFVVGADPSNYGFQGSIVSPRLVDGSVYANSNVALTAESLGAFTSFPLDATPRSTIGLMLSNPVSNAIFPTSEIITRGSPSISEVNVAIDTYIPR